MPTPGLWRWEARFPPGTWGCSACQEMCIRDRPNAFADFVALRDKIHEVCEHTYE